MSLRGLLDLLLFLTTGGDEGRAERRHR